MIKVANKKTINNLSSKSLKAKKLRNIVAIIAIALTTILFTTLFTIGIGTVDSLQKATMRQAGGDGHVILKYMTEDQYDTVKEHKSIKKIAYSRLLCDDVENIELIKRRAEFWYYDEVALELGFIELKEGHMPQSQNEVIVDSTTLKLLGKPLESGQTIELQLNIRGQCFTRDFIVSGFWESDPAFKVGQIFASRAYVDAHLEELKNTYNEDHSYTGTINSSIMFSNSMNLQNKLNRLLTESGFSYIDGEENYIANNVNWAYISSNFGMDISAIMVIVFGILLVITTGYLIIYNIFQIAIIQDVRYYGLLKTIGTTGKQIKRIIRKQALTLSTIGIPLGLVVGFFIGKALIPLLMNNTLYSGSPIHVNANPVIFIFSILFSFLTIFISIRKPSKLASVISPIEAARYSEKTMRKGKKEKERNKKNQSLTMYRFAFTNIGRDKKRTFIVILSLSLCIILANTVVNISNSFDMNKYVQRFFDTDFLVAHAEYFNYNFYGRENQTSDSIIDVIEDMDGFEGGGRLYGGRENTFFAKVKEGQTPMNTNEKGDAFSAVFGLEALPFERLQLIDGVIDKTKLLSGKYILEGVYLDDNGNVKKDTANYKVGDKVTLYSYRQKDANNPETTEYTEVEFTVLGHVAAKYYINTDRTCWGYAFYLPAETYLPLVDNPATMSYVFNVEDSKEIEIEKFMKSYTTDQEYLMNFESKATVVSSFDKLRQTLFGVGGALSIIIGLIGLLNFINTMMTSIITRRKEFAMLESIGMTRKQLKRMLCFEGLYYGGISGICALIIGILTSFLIVKPLSMTLWFLSYQMVIWPLILAMPILLGMGYLIPNILFIITDKQSVVERLRITD